MTQLNGKRPQYHIPAGYADVSDQGFVVSSVSILDQVICSFSTQTIAILRELDYVKCGK